ncbi:hypothetical protein CVIRNUC_010267 [Coccomyxa viridis]|uniref:CCHC-type domain-containing protein n=1 Tax=Coccomyxa viridis TaxID=1274662 RepID=A0AAV1II92_9CHLO|nr:hypothetical protein CVIRNUC_010267 [Coccomyxa viridis]
MLPEGQAPDSHVLEDLSDSDTEKHPAEALIIRKAEQASAAAAADTQPSAEQVRSKEHHERSLPAPKASKGPALILAANPALAKARKPGKASAKGKKRSRDSKALEIDPGRGGKEATAGTGILGNGDTIHLASSDSEENGIALGNAPGARGKKQRITEPVGVRVLDEDEEPVLQAPEMQRLLRQPRYFDEDFEAASMRCYRCGGQGHMSFNCPNAEKQRPCYLCGQFGHNRADCPNTLCYKCNQPGHLARDCASAQVVTAVCLRCGREDCPAAYAGDYVRAEGGCAHDYDDADMQQARCMLCRRRGHFCCQSTARLPALKRSCYNCGDRNHTGEECWRDRPNAVVNERRNTSAMRGAVIQRSVPAAGIDHSYYQTASRADGEPLKLGGFGPQYGGTSYQERVSRMQVKTGEDHSMRTSYAGANTHLRFDANGDGAPAANPNRVRRRYGRR